MKKKYLYLIIPLAIGVLFADNLDEILSKLGDERKTTIPKSELKKIASPMPKVIIVDDNTTGKDGNKTKIVKKRVLKLKAVMNNKAFINNRWLKVGESIEGFKVADIMSDSVYITDGNISKVLFFDTNRTKIKIKLGR